MSRKAPESIMDLRATKTKRHPSDPPPTKKKRVKAKKKKKTKKKAKSKRLPAIVTRLNVRPTLARLSKGDLLLVARSSIDELVKRSHLKCDPAIIVFEILAPENFGGE